MRTRTRGVELIKEFEGLRLDAYRDAVGVWTIGFGHTRTAREGMSVDRGEAHDLLREDLKWAENAVNQYVLVDLNQGQFSALVSFVFNVGVNAFISSTLLQVINDEEFNYVPRELTRWVYAGGDSLKGLARRRVAEAALFMED